jgi:hypothetical protein
LRLIEATQAQETETAPGPRIVRAQAPDPLLGQQPPPPPPPPVGAVPAPAAPPNEEDLYCGKTVTSKSGGIFDQGKDAVAGIPGAFGNMFNTGGRNFLQSDHAFDVFSSPITNPFFFEDPRALTEIKPLMIYDRVPGRNPAFEGGDIWWYGVTGSVAISDMFSVVINKLGFLTVRPESTAHGINSDTGFSEFSLGPQFTFLRSECTKSVVAAGLLFDLAIGNGSVFQNTGDLSLVPYISYAQNFGKTDYGSFNYMTTFGYSFSTDNSRNDFFYWSHHLDFDLLNLNKIFPTIELNWFHDTTNGDSSKFFGFDGGDLMNFGAGGAAGRDDLTIAFGARYKFTEWLQTGFAFELPLVKQGELESYRFTFDLIFRY